jgi:hypothetical protein
MKIELAFAGDSSHAKKMYHTWEERICARIAASSASLKSSTREPEDVSEDGDEGEDEDEGKDGDVVMAGVEPGPSASSISVKRRVPAKVSRTMLISESVLTRCIRKT